MYGEITPAEKGLSLFDDDMRKHTVLLVTGIGNPKPLLDYLKNQVGDIIHFKKPDHYEFNETDLQDIKKKYDNIESKSKIILTTEKDLVRLKAVKKQPEHFFENLYYIPIEIKFLDRAKESFNKRILNYVTENRSNSRVHSKQNKL